MGERLEEALKLVQRHSEIVGNIRKNEGSLAAARYSFGSGTFAIIHCGAFLIDFAIPEDPVVGHVL